MKKAPITSIHFKGTIPEDLYHFLWRAAHDQHNTPDWDDFNALIGDVLSQYSFEDFVMLLADHIDEEFIRELKGHDKCELYTPKRYLECREKLLKLLKTPAKIPDSGYATTLA